VERPQARSLGVRVTSCRACSPLRSSASTRAYTIRWRSILVRPSNTGDTIVTMKWVSPAGLAPPCPAGPAASSTTLGWVGAGVARAWRMRSARLIGGTPVPLRSCVIGSLGRRQAHRGPRRAQGPVDDLAGDLAHRLVERDDDALDRGTIRARRGL